MRDMGKRLPSNEFNWSKGILFSLIAITFILYVYRNVIVFNVEFVLVAILLLSSFVVFKIKGRLPTAIWIWSGLLILYWLTTFVATYAHDSPDKRALTILAVVSLIWIFIALTAAVYKLKLGVDFFWSLMVVGGIVALSLGVLDAYEYGWFHSGIDDVRLGNLNSNAIKYAVIVNGFFVILLGALPWAFKKSRWLLSFVLILVCSLLVMAILTKSRTAWIGWPEAIVGWGIYYFYLFRNFFPKIKYPKTSFVLLIGVSMFGFMQIDAIKKPIVERSLQAVNEFGLYVDRQSMRSSVGYRLTGYEIAIEKIPEVFWFGIGEDAFPEFIRLESKRFAKEQFNTDIRGFSYSQMHNQFLMSFLTKGFFVFASVLFFFVFLIIFFTKRIRQVSEEVKPIAIAGLIFSTSSFFAFLPETPLQNTDMSTHFFLLCSLLIAFSLIDQQKLSSTESNDFNG
jgi:O-antigen ligase